MKTFIVFSVSVAVLGIVFTTTDIGEKFKMQARHVGEYESKALQLARENIQLKAQLSDLQFKLQSIETEKNFLQIKLGQKMSTSKGRNIASFSPADPVAEKVVKQNVFKWSPKQLSMLGDHSFKTGDYVQASYYYNTLIQEYGKDSVVNDRIYYQAGFSAYKTSKYNNLAVRYLDSMIEKYPTSAFFRKAKLWRALAWLKEGKVESFYKTVEEFRLKYRNTNEWKILSGHYEEIREKFKPDAA